MVSLHAMSDLTSLSLPPSAINFARDFGPRLFLFTIGYPTQIFTHDNFWCLWGPGLGSTVGGLIGALVYDAFVYTGTDSPLNRLEGGRANPLLDDGSALLEEEEA